ncbi:helix-turn-helix domain-containing protein [Lacticaseibacillus kribbianus]|uniref:helix-turn-helix domain-containing protein n=1 Tax=Lacticaseibacillus kribbianus TaxID=2926292 RepID=UPI001CD2483B|nr:helix-turn-helix domain-containing protein [Lacticaseibacillus kribbianus]
MKELIYSFLPSQFSDPSLFWIELAGVTYPFPSYHVERTHSAVFCLEHVDAGRGILEADGVRHLVQGGDTYLLPAGADHRYWSDPHDPMQKRWVNFAGAVPTQLVTAYQLSGQVVFPGLDVGPQLDALHRQCADATLTPVARGLEGSVAVHRLLFSLHAFAATHARVQQAPEAAVVRGYLDNHLEEPVTIAQLAALVSLSPSQLTRQFKQAFGTTPYAYLQDRRLAMAKTLLRHTSLPVTAIASRLSFADAHYFSNAFTKAVGVRPGEWRRRSD